MIPAVFKNFFVAFLIAFLQLPNAVDKSVQNGGMRADCKLTPVLALLCNCNGFCPFLRFGGIPPVPIIFLYRICKDISHAFQTELFNKRIFKAFVQVHTVEIVSDRLLYLVLALDIRLQRLSVQIFLAVRLCVFKCSAVQRHTLCHCLLHLPPLVNIILCKPGEFLPIFKVDLFIHSHIIGIYPLRYCVTVLDKLGIISLF